MELRYPPIEVGKFRSSGLSAITSNDEDDRNRNSKILVCVTSVLSGSLQTNLPRFGLVFGKSSEDVKNVECIYLSKPQT